MSLSSNNNEHPRILNHQNNGSPNRDHLMALEDVTNRGQVRVLLPPMSKDDHVLKRQCLGEYVTVVHTSPRTGTRRRERAVEVDICLGDAIGIADRAADASVRGSTRSSPGAIQRFRSVVNENIMLRDKVECLNDELDATKRINGATINDLEGAVQELGSDSANFEARLKQKDAELEALRKEHRQAVDELQTKHKEAIAELKTKHEETVDELNESSSRLEKKFDDLADGLQVFIAGFQKQE